MFPGGAIMHPRMPYEGPIQGALQHGMMVLINGSVPHGAGRFSINLACGSGSHADIALHFNPRFEGVNAVIRNTKQHNNWGPEERTGAMPFRQGMQFEMIILVQHDCYKVAVNGQHFTEFRHRIPMHRVTTLSAEGNVSISSIRYQQPNAYPPAPAPAMPPAGLVPGGGYDPSYGPPQPVYNPPVPHESHVPGGLYPGRMVYISGTPHPNISRFTVNLKCSNRDTALHFDVRFNYGNDRHVIVRNSEMGGRWGTEERQASYFPFVPNGKFDMIILCETNCFKVAVNNSHFLEYCHRVKNLHTVDTVTVDGDVSLTQVRHQ